MLILKMFTERRSPGNEDMFSYAYKFEKGGMISFRTINVNRTKNIRVRSKIAVVGDNLILANPGEGTIIVFDFDGNKVSELTMNLGENYISVEDQKQIQMKNIEKFSKKDPLRYNKKIGTTEADSKKAHEYFIAKMKEDLDRIKEPIRKPYFSTVLRDSDDNLLFFELPDEENTNVFNVWVYNNGGEFLCQSSFVCDEYELQVNPSKMVFRDGFIYGLQKLKNVEGVPLRLVKFKLQ